MAEVYPKSFFEVLGVSKEEGMRAIGRSHLTPYQKNILYKRWGEGYDGTKRDPNAKLSSHEVRDLRFIISIVASKINMFDESRKCSVIIEHREEVNKYLGENQNISKCISNYFPDYILNQIKPVIFRMYKKYYPGFRNNELLEEFIKNNYDLILKKFDECGIDKQDWQKLKILTQDDLMYNVLVNIRDKYFTGVSLENLIISAKISMIKNGLKSYNNCISLLNYLLVNRFSVFKMIKLRASNETDYRIDCILYLTNDNGTQFLDVDLLLKCYAEGIESGLEKCTIIEVISEQFRLNEKLINEILEIHNAEITSLKRKK